MPKEIENKFTKHIQIIALILGIMGCVSGMYASARNFENTDDTKDMAIESRIVRIETKVDMIISLMSKSTSQ